MDAPLPLSPAPVASKRARALQRELVLAEGAAERVGHRARFAGAAASRADATEQDRSEAEILSRAAQGLAERAKHLSARLAGAAPRDRAPRRPRLRLVRWRSPLVLLVDVIRKAETRVTGKARDVRGLRQLAREYPQHATRHEARIAVLVDEIVEHRHAIACFAAVLRPVPLANDVMP